jgi:hypothetical protein
MVIEVLRPDNSVEQEFPFFVYSLATHHIFSDKRCKPLGAQFAQSIEELFNCSSYDDHFLSLLSMSRVDLTALLTALKEDNPDHLFALFPSPSHALRFSFSQSIPSADLILQSCPPLSCAAAYFSALNCLTALHGRGDAFTATDKRGRSISEFAVAAGALPVVDFLATHGVSFAPSVFLAAQLGRTAILEYIADNLRQDDSAVDPDGRTILHIASLSGHVDTVQYIVERVRQINPNAGDNEGNTALHLAVQKEHLDVLNFLFTVDGIDANPINLHRESLLHFAAKIANSEILTAVLQGCGIGESPDRVVYFSLNGIS